VNSCVYHDVEGSAGTGGLGCGCADRYDLQVSGLRTAEALACDVADGGVTVYVLADGDLGGIKRIDGNAHVDRVLN